MNFAIQIYCPTVAVPLIASVTITLMACNDAITRTENIRSSQAKIYRDIIKGKDPVETGPVLLILDDGEDLAAPPASALEDARRPMDTASSRQQAVEVLRPLGPSHHPASSSSSAVVDRPRQPSERVRADTCTYEAKENIYIYI